MQTDNSGDNDSEYEECVMDGNKHIGNSAVPRIRLVLRPVACLALGQNNCHDVSLSFFYMQNGLSLSSQRSRSRPAMGGRFIRETSLFFTPDLAEQKLFFVGIHKFHMIYLDPKLCAAHRIQSLSARPCEVTNSGVVLE